MNKRLFYAVVLLAIAFVGLSSSTCSPDPEPEKNYYVNVDQSTVSFDANGGSATVLVKSNTSWKIAGIPDWLSVSPTSGANDAAITLSTSSSSTTRNCSLTISTGGASATINVSQDGGIVPPYIGAWMLEELGDDDYWVCYQVINPDGTGIYQEFDCKLNSFRVTENEYALFTWTLTNNGNALRVNYNDGGDYETWDVSNINGNIWGDGGDIAYKQTDYTANPSITGTWKWTYYDESLELVLNSNKTGTYKYWDDNRLDESYSFSYTNTSTSLTLTSSRGTKEFSIALLTYNRLVVSARNERGEVFGMVFKKQ